MNAARITRELMLLSAAAFAAASLRGQGNDLAAPFVIVVADGERGAALEAIVAEAGLRRGRLATAACVPTALRLADVVLVDWPEDAALGQRLPLGELDRWDRPTVFFGTSGECFARHWGLPGPADMAKLGQSVRGPEMARLLPPQPATTEVWRQGHLVYFPCTRAPAELPRAEREWLVRSLHDAARFTADRPIVRYPTADGAPLSEAEVARRQRVAEAAARLQIDVREREHLLGLPAQLRNTNVESMAAPLLADLVTEGPGAFTTRNTWGSWLRPRGNKLVWDDLSQIWRLDQVAYWRNETSDKLRGADRASGGERDAETLDLATKVVQRYGGRGLDDLQTFTCWYGHVHYSWDRRGGWFRMENHEEMPAGHVGRRWQFAVFDTAADREVIWPRRPRPLDSARDAYRELVVRVFLPAMLLDPGVFVARRPESDSGKLKALVVRPGQRGLDARTEYVLVADGDNGAIDRVEEHLDGRPGRTWTLTANTICGPMELPASWSGQLRRRQVDYKIEEPTWNPELPPDIATTTERLTEPRAR